MTRAVYISEPTAKRRMQSAEVTEGSFDLFIEKIEEKYKEVTVREGILYEILQALIWR